MAEESSSLWNVDMEVSLFHAMRRHKPVGVNRHFHMMCIHEKLNSSISKKISAKQIWQRLSAMFDLQALNESEIVPFPNKELEFCLPQNDFSGIAEQEFPRIAHLAPPVDIKDTKESSREGSGNSERSSGKSRPSALEKAAERLAEPAKADELPKREHRKRTRQNTQSPASTSDSPAISKRARRT
ncbi:hypothetical protein LSAT2_030263 [Lamellibrachia satsuma]|nr:hypothetical protein LSAT2_030263 [Lamellibrachia satsuma]